VEFSHHFASVASFSVGNDDFVGRIIADALERIGHDGVISIESSSSSETFVVVEEGMKVVNFALGLK